VSAASQYRRCGWLIRISALGVDGPGDEAGAEEDRFRFDLFIRLHQRYAVRGRITKKPGSFEPGFDYRTNYISEVEPHTEPEVPLIQQARKLLRLRNLVESAQI
jgi:hypothetical protein